jgi:hypothetical protein
MTRSANCNQTLVAATLDGVVSNRTRTSMPTFCLTILLLMASLLAASGATKAAESYANCTNVISSLPAVINASGTWCVEQNLSTAAASGVAVSITASNVTLDCNDFKIDGSAAGAATTTTGVDANDRINVTVRRCDIRGFKFGLSLGGSSGMYLVEDNRLDGSTNIGMYVTGSGSLVRRNRVFNTGGSTATNANPNGIYTDNAVDVLNNTVDGVTGRSGTDQSVFGIFTSSAIANVSGNRVRGLVKDGGGVVYGIYNNIANRVIMRNNDLVGDAGPSSIGLVCGNSSSRAKDNVLSGFTTGILNCGNSGGNVIKP